MQNDKIIKNKNKTMRHLNLINAERKLSDKPSYHDLIKRVQQLEDQIRAQQTAYVQTPIQHGSPKDAWPVIRTFIEYHPLPTFIWQRRNSQILLFHCNKAALTLNRKPFDAIVGQLAKEILADHPFLYADIHRCFGRRQIVKCGTERTFRPSGEKRTFQNTFLPFSDDYVIECVEDMTIPPYSMAVLQESAERFRELADSLSEIIYEIDASGTLTYFNQQGFNDLNYSPDIIGQLTVSDLVIPADREIAAVNFKRFMQGENLGPNEYEVLRSDGSTFTGLFHSKVFYKYGRPAGLRGFVLDITERKATERQLKRRLRYEKMIGELAFCSLRIPDLKAFYQYCVNLMGECLKKSGCYIWKYNNIQHQLSTLGEWSTSGVPSLYESLPQIEIVEASWWAHALDQKRALIHKENKELFNAQLNKQLNALGLKRLLATPLFVQGILYGFLGVSIFYEDRKFLAEDIDILKTAADIISKTTESHQLQDSLRYKENHLRTLLHTIPHGVQEIDCDGTIEYSNLAHRRLTGCTKKEIIGKSIYELLPNDKDRRQLKDHLQFLVQNQPAPTPWIGVNLSKSGHKIDVQVDWNYRRNSKGEVTGFIAVVTDISERLKAQRQLEKAHAYLEDQVVMRTKQLSQANMDLKSKQEKLIKTQKQLARLNRELNDSNNALTVLAKNLDRNKYANDRESALIISSKLLPITNKLRAADGIQAYQADLETLDLYLNELAAPLENSDDLIKLLSATEMKIATMIKNGKTTPQISKALFVAQDTVKSHRRSIRRKLGLKNAAINLKNYLRLKLEQ